MNIEQIATAGLTPYARNSRTHSAEQVQQVAASIKEFGFTNPILIDGQGGIIAGHGRLQAAQLLGLEQVPCLRLGHLTEAQKRAYIIADNKLALNSGWDEEMLALEIADLQAFAFDLDLLGFDEKELQPFTLEPDPGTTGLTDPDQAPEAPAQPASRLGDLWQLGEHRVLCGDSTSSEAVARLMAGRTACLLHADPPYGMGKEADGVLNDNLYREKLDAFQLLWWSAFRPHLADNGSAYIWGNAPDLWRLWYSGGLSESEYLTLKNEVVWDKGDSPGQKTAGLRSFAISTERCLFFMFGAQAMSANADNFFEGFEPIRAYLAGEKRRMGWTDRQVGDFFGYSSRMPAHWFSRSQWMFPTREVYTRLQAEAAGTAFERDYEELKRGYEELKRGYAATRAYFDNTHDIMRDVWEFPRVVGEDRHGHATPKPVAMMARVMHSSAPVGGLVVEPFGGSGSTLVGAESTGRTCYTVELDPRYVDVIVRRWQEFTGQKATLEGDGRTFAEIQAERCS